MIPSKLLTDTIIYCDLKGKSKKKQNLKFTLSVKDQNRGLSKVKEKSVSLDMDEDIKTFFKDSNFIFSNPYKNQIIKIELGSRTKKFFFDGIAVH